MFKKKPAVKQRYRLTYVMATGLPDGVSSACVGWKRGSKKENQGTTASKPVRAGTCEWAETVTVTCTLFKEASSYDAKNIIFYVKEDKGKKKRTLGKTTVNMSDYADLGGAVKTATLNLKKKGSKGGPLSLLEDEDEEKVDFEAEDKSDVFDKPDKLDKPAVEPKPTASTSPSVTISITAPAPSTTAAEESVPSSPHKDSHSSKKSHSRETSSSHSSKEHSHSRHHSSSSREEDRESAPVVKDETTTTPKSPSSVPTHSDTHTDASPHNDEISSLREQIATLTKSRDTLKTELDKKEKSAKHSQHESTKEIETLKTKLSELSTDHQKVKDDLLSKENHIRDIESAHSTKEADLVAQIRVLEAKGTPSKSSSAESNTQLTEQLTALEKKMNAEKIRSEKTIADLKTALERTQADLKQSEEMAAKQKKPVKEDVAVQLQKLTIEMEQTKAKVRQYEEEVAGLSKENSGLKAQYAESQKAVADFKSKLANLSSHPEAERGHKNKEELIAKPDEGLETKCAGLKVELDTSNKRVVALEAELQEQLKVVTSLKGDVARITNQFEKANIETRAAAATAESQINSSHQQIKLAEDLLITKTATWERERQLLLQSSGAAQADLQQQLQTATEKETATHRELEAARNSLQEMTIKLSHNNTQTEQIRTELQTSKKTNTDLQSNIERLKTELKRQTDDSEKLQQQLKHKTSQIDRLKEERDNLAKRVEQAASGNSGAESSESISRTVATLRDSNHDLLDKLESETSSLARVSQQLTELNAEKDELSNKLRTALQEIDDLRHKQSELESQNSQLSSELSHFKVKLNVYLQSQLSNTRKTTTDLQSSLTDRQAQFLHDTEKIRAESRDQISKLEGTRTQMLQTMQKLKEQVKKLEGDRDELEEKLRNQLQVGQEDAQELESLRKKLKESQKAKKKMERHAQESGDKQLLAKVQQAEHKLKIEEFLLNALFSADSSLFDAQGVPCTALLIIDRLQQWNSLKKPDSDFFEKIAERIKTISLGYKDNLMMSTYFVTVTWSLLNFVQGTLVPPSRTEYILKPSAAPEGEVPRFVFQLQQVLHEIFFMLLQRTEHILDGILCQAIFEPPEQLRVSGASRSAAAKPKGGPSITDVIQILQETLQRLLDNGISRSICFQFFSQLCYWINARLFNQLVNQPGCCTCGKGFQIKLGLSSIEEFLYQSAFLSRARQRLDHIKQAGNLLIMDKAVLFDETIVHTAFSALNPVQLAHIVHSFKPDSLMPDPVAPSVLGRIQRLNPSSSTPLILDPNILLTFG
ncbi:DIL domain [Pelomyxa schiedti]|nr:DIL domain [Pelomyxa schiedti]